jgi:N-acyl homoserine lactone hydrolase
VQVDVIVTGELPMPPGYVFREGGNRALQVAAALRPGREPLPSQCLAFVVRHPDVGAILVDTGLHPAAAEDLRGDFGPLMALVFRRLRPTGPFDAQLQALGVEPDAVTQVVMTHLHVDHTSGMRLLPSAEFVCAREEWTAATGRGASRAGYAAHHLPDASRMRLVDFETEGEPHGPFDRTIDLLGDGSLRLVSTPGHTSGHLSVLLDGAGEHPVLLVGDAAYTLRSIDEQRLPLFTADDADARHSLGHLKAYMDAEPQATLVPTHDPEAWRALGAASPAAG